MVPNRSNVVEPMPQTLKSIESRENERDSIERRTIERRSTLIKYLEVSLNQFLFSSQIELSYHEKSAKKSLSIE